MATSENLPELTRQYVGHELVRKETYSKVEEFGIPELDEPLQRVRSIDPKRAGVVSEYFKNMKLCLLHWKRRIKPGGYCVILIGDSKIRGNLVTTHSILSTLGRSTGYTLEHDFKRPIDQGKKQTANAPNDFGGGAINSEHLLVLKT